MSALRQDVPANIEQWSQLTEDLFVSPPASLEAGGSLLNKALLAGLFTFALRLSGRSDGPICRRTRLTDRSGHLTCSVVKRLRRICVVGHGERR